MVALLADCNGVSRVGMNADQSVEVEREESERIVLEGGNEEVNMDANVKVEREESERIVLDAHIMFV